MKEQWKGGPQKRASQNIYEYFINEGNKIIMMTDE